MEFVETGFDGLIEIYPRIFRDKRGYFLESYRYDLLADAGIKANFVQDNQSFSEAGIVRGLHLQRAPWAQGKLVKVVTGKIRDIVVDIRPGSTTFGKSHTCTLDAQKQNMIYVPEGFAHGFATIEPSIITYKTTNYYNKESEAGIRWDDPELDLNWGLDDPLVSEKDSTLPTFTEFKQQFL